MVINSPILRDFLTDELERTVRMLSKYAEQLESYPKGSVYVKKSGKQSYVYRVHREGGRVVSECLGNVRAVDADALLLQSEGRKNLERVIAGLNVEKKDLERILG